MGQSSLTSVNNAINYIAKDSSQNAEKVKKDIIEKILELSNHPEIYAPDKYKQNNDVITGLLNCIVIVFLIMFLNLK